MHLYERSHWSRILIAAGGVALLLGALDPMEGAIVILLGGGLTALGTFWGSADPRVIRYRVGAFLLIGIGVAALIGLSQAGGLGGKSGLPLWWGLLVLPYLMGWSMSIWGPGSRRWLLVAGIVVSLFYLVLAGVILTRPGRRQAVSGPWPGLVLAATGAVTVGGCVIRLCRGDTSTSPNRRPDRGAGQN